MEIGKLKKLIGYLIRAFHDTFFKKIYFELSSLK